MVIYIFFLKFIKDLFCYFEILRFMLKCFYNIWDFNEKLQSNKFPDLAGYSPIPRTKWNSPQICEFPNNGVLPLRRGAFIVLEGCDRSGKSTLSRMLFEHLQSRDVLAKHMCFPERASAIGQTINAYLRNQSDLPDEVIHLLFTANRWEFKNQMEKLLTSGTTLVVDRYSYSGAAYSVAKGLCYDWCMAAEKGLLRPDAVFYLKAPIEKLLERGNFGEERYEKADFQRKVAAVFDRIYQTEQSYWHEVDATQPLDNALSKIGAGTLQVLAQVQHKPLSVMQ